MMRTPLSISSRWPAFATAIAATTEQVFSWTVGIVMIISGVRHISNPYYFLGSVYAYDLVDAWVGQLVAGSIPIAMLVSGFCILADVCRLGGFAVGLGLFGIFTSAQLIAWMRGLRIECGCFGASYGRSAIGGTSLLVATVMLVAIAYCMIRMRKRMSAINTDF